ncbi:MAG: ABC transporter ATP-binding protein [Desulfovibrionaceae bacterium]
MLELHDVSVCLRGRTIVRDISLSVEGGSVCALIGPNGAGKSTLVKAVSGLLAPSGGSIAVDGRPLSGACRRELARLVSYLPQKTTPVPCSVFDAVLLGRKPHFNWRPGRDDRAQVERVVEEFGLGPLRDACATRISGGEFQKMLIARSLVQGARVLVLDEPINHLDIKNQVEIMDLITRLTRERGLITLIVLHDLNLAVRHADSVLLIREGRPVYCGETAGLSPRALSEAYEIPVTLREVGGATHVLY